MPIDLVSVSTGPSISQVTGPLANLDQPRPSLTPLVYPADLGSSTKNHYVKFSIKQIVPSTPVSGDEGSTLLKDVASRIASFNYATPTTDAIGVICLYMPDSLIASYNASYDQLNLTNNLGKGITAIQGITSFLNSKSGDKNTTSATSSDPSYIAGVALAGQSALQAAGLGGNGIVDFALQSQGFAINPQLQVIYRGIDFRKFQLSFIFTPASQEEALMVNRIIATFKYHFAPELITSSNAINGMFFTPPSFFNVEFMFNNDENQFLPRYGDCVLTDIDVNFAPNGFASHNDGAPVQTTLTLGFQEIEIVTKAKIASGYGATSRTPFKTTSESVAGLR